MEITFDTSDGEKCRFEPESKSRPDSISFYYSVGDEKLLPGNFDGALIVITELDQDRGLHKELENGSNKYRNIVRYEKGLFVTDKMNEQNVVDNHFTIHICYEFVRNIKKYMAISDQSLEKEISKKLEREFLFLYEAAYFLLGILGYREQIQAVNLCKIFLKRTGDKK